MLVIESATSTRFSSARFPRSSLLLPRHVSSFVPWNKIGRLSHCSSCTKWNKSVKNGIRASAGGLSGPLKPNKKPQRYHPSEDISDSESDESGVAVLKPAETCRTVIEVNSKALVMFAGVISDEIQDSLFWPDLPYVTDEHGNIYLQVKNNENILQSLTSDDKPVDVIIGLDTSEMINEMESIRADSDFDDEEIDYEDSDIDNDSTDDEEEDEDEDDEFTDEVPVKLEDFRRAKPDAIAHSAAKIIARVKAGGDKTALALKSLCWRSKGIQVEEVALIGVDSLGFDLRVCSGRQVQTLRFGFHKRAYSEYSAERQLNCLLFPRTGHQQKRKEAHQSNCDDVQVP